MFFSQAIYACYIMPEDRVAALAEIISIIDNSQKTFSSEQFNFSEPNIEKALERAKARGVDVDLIEDSSQAGSKSEIVQNTALEAAIGADHVSKTSSEMGHFMHLKTAQSDSIIVIEGSTNWSPTAFEEDQTLIIFYEPQLASIMSAKHARLKDLAKSRLRALHIDTSEETEVE